MKISEFQTKIRDLYFEKDEKRGIERTFIWLVEEIGELATLLNKKKVDIPRIEEELSDILAWTISLANLFKIDIESALKLKYADKCTKCGSVPCCCEN